MFVWDVLFPARCFGCGFIGVYICPSCEAKLAPLPQQACLYCGRPSLFGLTHPTCTREGARGFISLFHYNPTLKRIIKGIKYSLVKEARRDLLYLIAKTGQKNLSFYKTVQGLSIEPIPLSAKRMSQRGFNQSLIIAKSLSFLLNIPITSILERVREGAPQATLGKRERRKNMRGAFRIAKKTALKSVLLVDDVLTTGETMNQAAKTLKKGGVKNVYVFTVAKG